LKSFEVLKFAVSPSW